MEKNNHSAALTNSSTSFATTATSAPPAAPCFSAENSNGGNVSSAGSARSATTSSSNYLANSNRVLNKSSYKISKPISRNPNSNLNPIRPSLPPSSAINAMGGGGGGAGPQQQPQPPVYNIDKNDFRDVVQKLTGSPAHLSNRQMLPSVSTTSPLQPPPRPSAGPQPLSRLHRIRPPPLAQLSPHPPIPAEASSIGEGWVRPPLSPLPPFPAVSAAAESPISAYMRRFHSGLSYLAPSPPGMASGVAQPPLLLPLSPLSFGCAPSPRTAMAYQAILSPTLLFPSSPGMPIPSPK